MRVLSFAAVAAVMLSGLAACAMDPGTDSSSTNEALKGGCRMVCPKCTPNMTVCPMIACQLDCNGKPQSCVDNQLCPIGYSWDKKACSCEPTTTTTCVDTVMCMQGYTWDSTACQCVPN